MRRARRRGGRAFLPLVVAGGVALGVGQLDLAAAIAVTATSSGGSSITAGSVAPPSDVVAVMTANVTPALSCRVAISWTASPSPGVTGYEVVRVVASTGATAAGPWSVTGTAFVDDPVPLASVVNAYEWQVRAVTGGWASPWVAASTTTLVNCLL